MPKIEPFEKYTDAYDEWFIQNADAYNAELQTIRQLIPSGSSEGLEVGVGSGNFAAPLGIKTGVEPSAKMAERAVSKGIEVCSGVAENLPFSDERFDFVLMVTTICFVDDIVKSFDEAFRVIKDSGCVVVGFVDKESDLGREYLSKKEDSAFYREADFFSTQEVLHYLEDAGFVDMEIRQTLLPGQPQGTIVNGYGDGGFVAIRGSKGKAGHLHLHSQDSCSHHGRRAMSPFGYLFRFIGWWFGLTGLYAMFAVCPFCGQTGCPVGLASAGTVGAFLSLCIQDWRRLFSFIRQKFSRRKRDK